MQQRQLAVRAVLPAPLPPNQLRAGEPPAAEPMEEDGSDVEEGQDEGDEERRAELDRRLAEFFLTCNNRSGASRLDMLTLLMHEFQGLLPSYASDTAFYKWAEQNLITEEDGWQSVVVTVSRASLGCVACCMAYLT